MFPGNAGSMCVWGGVGRVGVPSPKERVGVPSPKRNIRSILTGIEVIVIFQILPDILSTNTTFSK